jgi:hypothetical protein
VAGLLSWLLIAAELILIAAELNVVLAFRLWSRSPTGELLEAEKQPLKGSAQPRNSTPRQDIAGQVHALREGANGQPACQEQRSDDDP